ncbi:MAG: hypothetical protein LQ342_000137 [Letrouitia transgressa]|nr:MAG: hypothetical protein LQ342_000137 [Letrouitia transgressa]
MYIRRFLEPFLLCSLALPADSAPVNPNSPIQPRIPYSVVAVDGGVTAISSQAPLPTKTITQTVARTKTAERTKTLTGPASTDPVSTVTLTTSHTSITKVVVTPDPSTVTACNSNLPVIPPGTTKPANTMDFVPEILSLEPQQSTSKGDTTLTASRSTIRSAASSCMNMTVRHILPGDVGIQLQRVNITQQVLPLPTFGEYTEGLTNNDLLSYSTQSSQNSPVKCTVD